MPEQERSRVVLPYGDWFLFEELEHPPRQGKLRCVGGGVNQNETPFEAILRELKEELKYIAEPGNIIYLGRDPRSGHEHEHYFLYPNHRLKPGRYEEEVPFEQYGFLHTGTDLVAAEIGDLRYIGAPLQELLLAHV